MVARRVSPYAQAFSFGIDGQATVAGSPIARAHGNARANTSRKRMAVSVPMWGIVVAVAAVIFLMGFFVLGMRSETTLAQKRITALKSEMTHANELIESLEINLESACSPNRIRSVAENRLGMRLPTTEQIEVIPRPQIPQKAQEIPGGQQDSGVFRILLSLIGL